MHIFKDCGYIGSLFTLPYIAYIITLKIVNCFHQWIERNELSYCRDYSYKILQGLCHKIIASRNFGEVIPVIFVNILVTSLITIKMPRILL